MVAKRRIFEKPSLFLMAVHMTAQVLAGAQFTSHVSVSTPARSFTHGVGNPISVNGQPYRNPQQFSHGNFQRYSGAPSSFGGYPRMRPAIPFTNEDIPQQTSITVMGWNNNNYREETIPVLPPSPYKVNSPDPESLWPEGLFLPPSSPPRFSSFGRRLDDDSIVDPYLLEGSEAIAAVQRAKQHGNLYFHEIPHIPSLLANQELRAKNRLKPHLIASIRHTWPYNRP
ncbi:hypothetical protein O3G_MSEX006772 [Manduca sexta]|uniref:Uncharacterized protein n=2 Tax=Manduca sexta TaxID=7130 RepID=A0A921Z4L7_MANSE|nr:hypothetical protein O3G_MSEX006772 [Manduca sexta]